MNGVVPVSMKVVWNKSQGLHIGVRNLDSERIRTRVEFRFHRETGRRPHVANELHDRLVIEQRSPTPVLRDVADESVLNLVPFGRPGRKVGDADGETRAVREPLQFRLPDTGPRAIAATRVGGDEQG